MKKFYVMASMLGLGMLGLAGVTPTLVSASDVTSNGQVKFKLDQSQTDPKNPLDPADKNPGKPTDPTHPGGKVPGGTGGPLSILSLQLSFLAPLSGKYKKVRHSVLNNFSILPKVCKYRIALFVKFAAKKPCRPFRRTIGRAVFIRICGNQKLPFVRSST